MFKILQSQGISQHHDFSTLKRLAGLSSLCNLEPVLQYLAFASRVCLHLWWRTELESCASIFSPCCGGRVPWRHGRRFWSSDSEHIRSRSTRPGQPWCSAFTDESGWRCSLWRMILESKVPMSSNSREIQRRRDMETNGTLLWLLTHFWKCSD